MIALFFGMSCGVVLGGAIVFATISWMANHVATVERGGSKYGMVRTDRVLLAIKIR